MRIKIVGGYLLMLFMLPFLPACNKSSSSANNSSADTSSCKLTMTQSSTGESYAYTYDAQGRVASEKYTTGSTSLTRTFVYGAGLEVISNTDQNQNSSIDTVWINSQGYVLSDSNSIKQTTDLYNYNSANQLQTRTHYFSDLAEGIHTALISIEYTYAGADLSIDNQGNSYTFYADQAVKTGDCLQLTNYQQFGNKGQALTSTHMLKSIVNSSAAATENYTYTYDKSGKVTAIQITGTQSEQINLTYDCH